MGKLINIDNGGTLTDICVIDGATVYRTKTVTTPYDLSKCFFDGLRKASKAIYGDEDLAALLTSTDHIRYSTTQGTNALVERRGPRLGLIAAAGFDIGLLQHDDHHRDLYAGLVGERSVALDASLHGAAFESAVVQAITKLGAAGANRIVIVAGGADRDAVEKDIRRVALRTFPPHLLGALPVLYAHEVVDDHDITRRAWTALFNAFLHPAMERFLYSAEHKLREQSVRNPLLIFRNDGHSARVARTIAVKTYSSGPRGGMEGAKALAAHYGFTQLLTMDIGGTTTDIGVVENGDVRAKRRGRIEGVAVSFPLCDVTSVGVGGSSIITVVNGQIRVGPQSVGGTPGPACFGLGGREATITDAFLVQGLLDPASYFGGELKIDVERARAAIADKVATPLGLSVEAAAHAMEAAWVRKVADALKAFTTIGPDTTLAAFGGAGPFVVGKVAEAAGINQVIIPGLAAVFSAFGLGFSDIAQHYEQSLASNDVPGFEAAHSQLIEQARRGMFAEGFALDDCEQELVLQVSRGDNESRIAIDDGQLPTNLPNDARLSLTLQASRRIARPSLSGSFGGSGHAATHAGTRRLLSGENWIDVPLVRAEQQDSGAVLDGPAVLEEAFYTARIEAGWRCEFNDAGDILLSRV